jgi:hypothetical protein
LGLESNHEGNHPELGFSCVGLSGSYFAFAFASHSAPEGAIFVYQCICYLYSSSRKVVNELEGQDERIGKSKMDGGMDMMWKEGRG